MSYSQSCLRVYMNDMFGQPGDGSTTCIAIVDACITCSICQDMINICEAEGRSEQALQTLENIQADDATSNHLQTLGRPSGVLNTQPDVVVRRELLPLKVDVNGIQVDLVMTALNEAFESLSAKCGDGCNMFRKAGCAGFKEERDIGPPVLRT